MTAKAPHKAVTLLGEYRGFRIVRFHAHWFGLPMELVRFDPAHPWPAWATPRRSAT